MVVVLCFLQVYQLQGQDVEVQSLTEECLTLKNKQTQLETARAEAQDPVTNSNILVK